MFRGFTLIELMVVVAIIGVIAAIAFPSYVRYVERTQFNDGVAGLMIAAQAMERCYVTEMSYDDCDAFPDESPEGFYAIALDDGAVIGQTYRVNATGTRGRVAAGDCSAISVDHLGQIDQGACPY
jgi:type IV pilus assembly protein PilE